MSLTSAEQLALQPPPAAARSRRGGAAAAEAARVLLRRRGRARLAGGAVSRRRGRRHARPRRLRRRRRHATCSGRSSTAPPTSADRSSSRRATGIERAESRGPRRDVRRAASPSANAQALVEAFDVIVDGTDNFPARYLVNDACVLVRQAERVGQHLPLRGAGVGVRRAGRPVLPLPASGTAAARARAELRRSRRARRACRASSARSRRPKRSKLILGIGEPLIGRFLVYDALRMRFRELRLPKDPDCPICGDRPTITALREYEAYCEVATREPERWRLTAARVEGANRRGDGADHPRRARAVRERDLPASRGRG